MSSAKTVKVRERVKAVIRTRFNERELFAQFKARGASAKAAAEYDVNPALEDIWNVIASIPRGRVSTYGDVARMAGLPGRARQTAYALRHIPEGMQLPWHRVLGAGGKIAFPKHSKHFREQARRLKSDGVPVKDGRVPRELLMSVDSASYNV